MHNSRDRGFTLVELLIVMVIIGILSSIAVPVFLSQRAKARDTATKQDVNAWGKEVAAYLVDGSGVLQPPDVATRPGYIIVTDDATPAYTMTVRLSPGTTLAPQALVNGSSPTTWCVALTNAAGSTKTYHYSASSGLGPGTC